MRVQKGYNSSYIAISSNAKSCVLCNLRTFSARLLWKSSGVSLFIVTCVFLTCIYRRSNKGAPLVAVMKALNTRMLPLFLALVLLLLHIYRSYISASLVADRGIALPPPPPIPLVADIDVLHQRSYCCRYRGSCISTPLFANVEVLARVLHLLHT